MPEAHGGEGLAGIANAVIVLEASGGALANPQLIGHLAATTLAAGAGLDEALAAMADGTRASFLAASFLPTTVGPTGRPRVPTDSWYHRSPLLGGTAR